MIGIEVGQRVECVHTGMVGTVTRTFTIGVGEWWAEVTWDRSTVEATELLPFDEDAPPPA